ncbi:MAG: ABC transporter substrate-binding protein [Alphaproteobacteria bacterium]|nr:ABC transporter substrate-binding protein [Alphaproteobacteria bacterium]
MGAIARIVLVAAVLVVGSRASLAESGAENFIRTLADRALSLVTEPSASMPEKRVRFDALLNETFDMPAIGRFLLGRYWPLATQEQREAYLKAFNENIVYTYTNRFNSYSGQTLSVDGSREDGQFVIVTSRIIDPNGGPPVVLDWRLVKTGDDYKVIDLKIEDVSMSITLRREYASLIENNGRSVQALIDALNKSMATLKARNS